MTDESVLGIVREYMRSPWPDRDKSSRELKCYILLYIIVSYIYTYISTFGILRNMYTVIYLFLLFATLVDFSKAEW